MPASFQMEALKVQSILSRTYALKRIETGRILTDTVSTQRYIDKDVNDSYSVLGPIYVWVLFRSLTTLF